MLGLTSKTSIRLWGSIAENSVMVLVDCGASHNFISDAVVKQQQMSITPTKSYIVEVGDERKIRCEGVCKNVKLHIQGMKIQQDLFLFKMMGVDVVLGIEWLASLGEIRANFRELTLKIPTTEGSFTLKGEPAMARSADVSSIGACRPRIFFINEFFCFLEDEWQRNGEGRERGDATSRRR